MLYDAFLSYSHAADGELVPLLQPGLQPFAKPWTGLTANPGLWSAIEGALELSEFFVLLASSGAAQSHWVDKEVAWWLAARPAKNLLIALADGGQPMGRYRSCLATGLAVAAFRFGKTLTHAGARLRCKE